MPRQPRLDAPGLLQHVMARGIERRKIFRDDDDRTSFLQRLALILEETQTQCYAWALMPNHFHLLLRTSPTPLSKVMRRLMTGYAVTFNGRHRRRGHLFQNRYKSVVCEEDPYLLELIRYIHLNPLRAKLVQDLKGLDKYPWTGHSAILGRRKNVLVPEVRNLKSKDQRTPNQPGHPNKDKASALSTEGGFSFSLSSHRGVGPYGPEAGKGKKREDPSDPVNPACPVASENGTGVKNEKPLAEKTAEDVLKHFGETFKIARRRYRQFVKNGIEQGKRAELQGGGLVRSAGGDKRGLLGRKKEERDPPDSPEAPDGGRGKGDERILGSGDFVAKALACAAKEWEDRRDKEIPVSELIEKVAFSLNMRPEVICSSSRKRQITEARALVCHFAINNLSYSASEVARSLSISRVNAGRCAERGKKVLDNYEDLKDIVQ